jgi:hypothetical protein
MSFIEFRIVIAPDDNINGIFINVLIHEKKALLLEQRIEVINALSFMLCRSSMCSLEKVSVFVGVCCIYKEVYSCEAFIYYEYINIINKLNIISTAYGL